MTTKSKVTVLAIAAAILVTSFSTAFANFEEEDEKWNKGMFQEKFQKFQEMDYETISERHLERTGEELTEETYNAMVEAHELMQAGDAEGAKAIMDELGMTHAKFNKMNKQKRIFIQNCNCEYGE